MTKDKTIYDLPEIQLKAYKKHLHELIKEAIKSTNDTSVKRGLMWADSIIENEKI